jgi:hypothetical protein
MRSWVGSLAFAALILVSTAAGAGQPAGKADQPAFKIFVDEDAVYGVSFEDLVAAGLPADRRPDAARLGLTSGGEAVGLWLDAGPDGRFGPGDSLEFVGEHPRGTHAYYDPHTRHRVYYLRLDEPAPARTVVPEPASCEADVAPIGVVRAEENTLRARFPSASRETDEIWYWARLSHADGEPFELSLALPGLAGTAGEPASLELHLRGWSSLPATEREARDHRIEARLQNLRLGATEWDNDPGGHTWRVEVPTGQLRETGNQLQLRVPARRHPTANDPIVDAVLLDWLEVRYPRSSLPPDGVFWTSPAGGDCLATADVPVYTPSGERLGAHARWRIADVAAASGPFRVAARRAPAEIHVDQPSALRADPNGADYLIVAHGSLLEAVAPLAELHRSRGLRVAVVDVEDVYDEFSWGAPSPGAIRSFVASTYNSWPRPAPRFLLLVGDASWDMRNDQLNDESYADWTFAGMPSHRFVKNSSTRLDGDGAGPEQLRRGLLPTWSAPTHEGDAASDNYFVALGDEDELPDLAVGRLPAATAEEARSMVDKTLDQYRASPGPWRRRALWLTNDHADFQRRSDALVQLADERGLVSQRVYPAPEEPSNEEHQAAIRRAFDDGQALVHFLGHGGRYIWRTGPPDISKNHDLFTLDDLDALAPRSALPIVLSMTCYSAPFDHPTADSIGEKLLRLPARGAAAVIAASWRNAPNRRIDTLLVEEVVKGGTVGEALQRAKRAARHAEFVRQYNLLGDPALPIPLPPKAIELQLPEGEPSTVVARLPAGTRLEHASVEWIAGDGSVVASLPVSVSGEWLTADFPGPAASLGAVTTVRIYAWNDSADAVGAVALERPVSAEVRPGRGGRS